MKVAVISPHPDDESIGCGGTICLHTARGDRVIAVVLTSGERGLRGLPREEAARVREQEAGSAAAILGLASVKFLRRPDGHLDDCVKECAKLLSPILERERPQVVYMPHERDWHPDHRASVSIVQRALADSRIPAPTLLSYEILTPLTMFDRAEDITSMMARKMQAVRAHRSQVRQLHYDRAARGLNEYRGSIVQSGRYVEVFQATDDRLGAALEHRRADPSWHHVYQLAQEIAKVIPSQDAFLLVGGSDPEAESLVAPRRCIPFLEKNGQYWGDPADDETAIREITRLQLSGAKFMVLPSSAFWWLDHYSGLRKFLQSRFQCILKNDAAVVFDLRHASVPAMRKRT